MELSRTLLALGRHSEAIEILQPGLGGPLVANNLHVTLTERHELLGRAWEAAGRPDSAAIHYRWVLNAWKGADPQFHARRDSLAARLRAPAPAILPGRPCSAFLDCSPHSPPAAPSRSGTSRIFRSAKRLT